MGWILPTPAGTYRVNWRDPAGKQRAKTLRTKRGAKAFLAQVEADASRGSYVDPHAGRPVLLRDFAADWLAGRTVEATTDERTRSILRTHVLPHRGGWPLARIDHVSVQQWVRDLAGRLAPATVAKAVNVLSLILVSAVRSQLLTVNPCSGLLLPSNRRAGDSILTVTREEFASKLLPAVPAEYRAIVCVAAGCGLRWGECAGLPWDAVDLDGAELRVRQVVVELSGHLDVRPYPKSRAGRRTVRCRRSWSTRSGRTGSTRTRRPSWRLARGPVRRCAGPTSGGRHGHRPWRGPGCRLGCASTTCGTATRRGSCRTACRSTSSAGSWVTSRSARP